MRGAKPKRLLQAGMTERSRKTHRDARLLFGMYNAESASGPALFAGSAEMFCYAFILLIIGVWN